MKKKSAKKLSLSKETLAVLDPKHLEAVAAAAKPTICQESVVICSVMHTCVSCQDTETCQ